MPTGFRKFVSCVNRGCDEVDGLMCDDNPLYFIVPWRLMLCVKYHYQGKRPASDCDVPSPDKCDRGSGGYRREKREKFWLNNSGKSGSNREGLSQNLKDH